MVPVKSVNVTVPVRSSPVSRNHSRRRASVGVLEARRESARWKLVRRVVRGPASVRGVMVVSFLCGAGGARWGSWALAGATRCDKA